MCTELTFQMWQDSSVMLEYGYKAMKFALLAPITVPSNECNNKESYEKIITLFPLQLLFGDLRKVTLFFER